MSTITSFLTNHKPAQHLPFRRATLVRIGLISLLITGAFLLLFRFPAIPAGLHQDEMSEAYESYCLLHTGADRWGYRLPVYFLGWGSGQNVLQAYLTVPVVAVLGLTRVSARLVPLVCGLLTLPLFFFTLRRWYGEEAALLGLCFLVFSPWHVMLSRWGVENSPLPFFMLLGIYTFSRALQSRSHLWIVLSLLPFALALYTYGLVIVIIPLLIPLLFFLDIASIRRQPRVWLSAVAVFCIAALPLLFFAFKNYVTKRNYGFERYLPFSVPLLPVTRLAQARGEYAEHSLRIHNLNFLYHGLADGMPWNLVPGIAPIPVIVRLFAVAGLFFAVQRTVATRRLRDPFLLWFLACLAPFLLVPMDMSRSMAIYLALLALAAHGAYRIMTGIHGSTLRIAFIVFTAAMFFRPVSRFLTQYYGQTYRQAISPAFLPELPEALSKSLQMAEPSRQVFISDHIPLNYVDVLFLTSTEPHEFQSSGATYDHPDFGRFRFSRASLATTAHPFVFLLKTDETPVCPAPGKMLVEGQLVIGVCP